MKEPPPIVPVDDSDEPLTFGSGVNACVLGTLGKAACPAPPPEPSAAAREAIDSLEPQQLTTRGAAMTARTRDNRSSAGILRGRR